ncbi:hypothetical protein AVEN_180468-1 [Araneus ventricosus]|uniref:Uncharacterized protein n=1 Tax=Araneus ventricosus TaxID=182803 RepID=A0A4Y2TQV6_ARAVE|nr:hypothetical protein AVEN_180468-1 [Araneus ventricosus]
MSSDVLDGEAKVRIFTDKLEKLYGICSNITEKKAVSKKQKDAFNDLKTDILMLYVDAVSKMVSVQENGADQPNNIMEMFIDLKREFSSFRIDINTKVDHISKQIAPEGIARQPELQELTLHEELVKVNLKPEVKTYVSTVRNSSSAVKRVKSDSKLVINGASKVSSLKSVELGLNSSRMLLFMLRFLRAIFISSLMHRFGLSSVASEDFDVICLTETWLCEKIDSYDLFDDRYLVSRKDRDSSTNSCKRGGGVIVAIKKNISASQIHVP